eukprot:TRINITY_DN7159_c0_g1_i4.p3 TRINITY_DN7159_c0_g1~~TRINITY_DN7159_c0_g1_i4.p3  ORF type:complete len:108 (-),score=4.11 TRINITY_DN7159_c0_g1_i4:361-684(-)
MEDQSKFLLIYQLVKIKRQNGFYLVNIKRQNRFCYLCCIKLEPFSSSTHYFTILSETFEQYVLVDQCFWNIFYCGEFGKRQNWFEEQIKFLIPEIIQKQELFVNLHT